MTIRFTTKYSST